MSNEVKVMELRSWGKVVSRREEEQPRLSYVSKLVGDTSACSGSTLANRKHHLFHMGDNVATTNTEKIGTK